MIICDFNAILPGILRKIAGIGYLNNGDRLKRLEILSLERRREGYQVINVFKIIQQLVPNFECEKFKVDVVHSERRGRLSKIPPITSDFFLSGISQIENNA